MLVCWGWVDPLGMVVNGAVLGLGGGCGAFWFVQASWESRKVGVAGVCEGMVLLQCHQVALCCGTRPDAVWTAPQAFMGCITHDVVSDCWHVNGLNQSGMALGRGPLWLGGDSKAYSASPRWDVLYGQHLLSIYCVPCWCQRMVNCLLVLSRLF